MTDYAYGPGEWTALAHGGRAALLDPAIDAESVTKIWDSLSQGGSLESWLEVLAGNGLASLPSFGFVEPADDGVRVVVRGEVAGIVEGNEISAGGMRTWREHVAAAESGVVLQVATSDVSHPLIGGVVLASTLQVGDLPEPALDGDAVAGEDGEVEPSDGEVDPSDGDGDGGEVEPSDDQPDDGAEASEGSDGEAVVAAGAAAAAGAFVVGEATPSDQADEAAAEEERAFGEEPAAEPEDIAAEPVQAEDEVEPDFVLDDDDADDVVEPSEQPGDDASQPAEGGTAVLEDLPDGLEAAGEAPVAPPAAQPWAMPEPAAPQANQWGPPVQQEAAPSFEQQPQEQPWQPQPATDQEQPWLPQQSQQQPEADLGDHDGYTMRAADLPKPDDEAPVDHTLAPAQDDEAGQESAPQGPVMQLSLSTGQQVELDRAVLIGRAPESSRFGFGETPRLVTVPSPQQDISRTHVEIKLEGDSVLVTDLRSTNGTVVVLPGAPPRRLHPGESVPVPSGTVVDLGDGVTAVVGLPDTAAPIAY